jgi:uncharacterized protein YjbI with pentapeptide repeats
MIHKSADASKKSIGDDKRDIDKALDEALQLAATSPDAFSWDRCIDEVRMVDIVERVYSADKDDLRELMLAAELSDLDGIDLRGARLAGQDLRGLSFVGADFTGADLRNADLSYADLQGAQFDKANLRGARIWNARLEGVRGIPLESEVHLDADRASRNQVANKIADAAAVFAITIAAAGFAAYMRGRGSSNAATQSQERNELSPTYGETSELTTVRPGKRETPRDSIEQPRPFRSL